MAKKSRRLSQIVLITVVTAVLMASSVVLGASSDGSLEKVKAAGVIRIGVDDAFPPMEYRDEKGNLIGFDVDLADE
ncbi:MAG: transporter substrate-binding domain-containing protein, partial [Firmicutes bacterium]|nr:transporter substrate-binding domain-containing protein [Bacillota bacterium]